MKTKLGYMVLGAVIGIGGMLIGMSLSSVTAQEDRFGVITCTRLNVVDADEKVMVQLAANERGGFVAIVNNKTGKAGASMSIDEQGGKVSALSEDLKSEVLMMANQSGGDVYILKNKLPRVFMSFDELGGNIVLMDKNGRPRRL